MEFPVGILGILMVLGIGIILVPKPKPPSPAKPRFLVIDTKEEKKD